MVNKRLVATAKRKMAKMVENSDIFYRGHVAECYYCATDKYGKNHYIREENMVCYAGVSNSCNSDGYYASCKNMKKVNFMLDNINDEYGKFGKPEERVRFLQYVMDHPILGKSFVEHDAKLALEEGTMVRDLSALPSNVTMFSLILTRALWEEYQGKLVERFCKLVDLGFTPDSAIILSFFVKTVGDGFSYSPLSDSGHNAVSISTATTGMLKNYVQHRIATPSKGQITEGYGTNGRGWSVFSTFRDIKNLSFVDEWRLDTRNNFIEGDVALCEWVKANIGDLKNAVTNLLGE